MDAARVLLVDDHPVLRDGLRNLLKHEPDIEVVGEAGDGLQALRLVRALNPDIVLMDVVMPGLSGIEATRQIKKTNPSVAVVILSAYDDDRYILGLLEAGAAGYLLKSVSAHEVVQSLRAVRAGESVLHPAVAARVLARAVRGSTSTTPSANGESLTPREIEVLRLAAQGKSNKEISSQLFLSTSTVKSHLVSIFAKMGVASRTEAVLEALRRGWVDIEVAEEPVVSNTMSEQDTLSAGKPPSPLRRRSKTRLRPPQPWPVTLTTPRRPLNVKPVVPRGTLAGNSRSPRAVAVAERQDHRKAS